MPTARRLTFESDLTVRCDRGHFTVIASGDQVVLNFSDREVFCQLIDGLRENLHVSRPIFRLVNLLRRNATNLTVQIKDEPVIEFGRGAHSFWMSLFGAKGIRIWAFDVWVWLKAVGGYWI